MPPAAEPVAPWKIIATLDAPGAGNWQGAVQNRETGEWFLCEAKLHPDGSEDSIFHRFSADQGYRDSMTAVGYGHQTGFSVDNRGTIWCSTGGRVVTLTYRPGKVTRKAAMLQPIAVNGTIQVTLSPTREWIVVRRIRTATEEYRLFHLHSDGAVTGQRGKTIIVNRRADRVCQGFGVKSFELKVLTGKSNGPSFVERYNFDTGGQLPTLDVTDYGMTAGQRDGLKNEVEGVDGDRIGVKLDVGDGRRLLVLDLA